MRQAHPSTHLELASERQGVMPGISVSLRPSPHIRFFPSPAFSLCTLRSCSDHCARAAIGAHARRMSIAVESYIARLAYGPANTSPPYLASIVLSGAHPVPINYLSPRTPCHGNQIVQFSQSSAMTRCLMPLCSAWSPQSGNVAAPSNIHPMHLVTAVR